MTLTEYFSSSDDKPEALAVRIGVSRGQVFRYISGARRVPGERAKAIEAATGGLVTRHELRPDLFGIEGEHSSGALLSPDRKERRPYLSSLKKFCRRIKQMFERDRGRKRPQDMGVNDAA